VISFLRPFVPLIVFGMFACAAAPKPTAEMRRIEANPRAVVGGRVTDAEGRPVGGISVRGIPRGRDIPWPPWTVTQCDGGYRLTLAAPAHYAFQLLWKGRSVITEDPRDPARLEIAVLPGERRTGVDLVFLPALWRPVTGPAWEPPGATPAAASTGSSPCP
jgi:hypothetical protein